MDSMDTEQLEEKMLRIPARPAPLVSLSTRISRTDLAELKTTLDDESSVRDRVLPVAKAAATAASNAVHAFQCGDYEGGGVEIAKMHVHMAATIDEVESATDGWFLRGHPVINEAMEKCVSAENFGTFLTTGTLPRRKSISRVNDEEYLCGVISLCHELNRYAVGRATVADSASVALCNDLVSDFFQKFLAFDFRNGNLRRRYDSLKYCVRRLESLLYELSLAPKLDTSMVTSANSSGCAATGIEFGEDFEEMRKAMEAYDKTREDVIKRTRDVQKLAKQAIFALHRGTLEAAEVKLTEAQTLAAQISDDHLLCNPSLRQGSYSSAIEEFVEARLFQIWLQDQDGLIAGPSHPLFGGLKVQPVEYLGALADFTGEVGRFAVQSATTRDEEKVRASLACALTVQRVWMNLGLTGKLGKKEGELNTNVKKMESVLYDLSLVKATGRKVQAESTKDAPEGRQANGLDEDEA